jgi:predicted negative regulator of RcsB-dependent stress response
VEDNLTDQQRAEQMRTWLRENGWYLLAGLALGLAGLFGWRQWDGYSTGQAEKASSLYDELAAAIRVDRTTRAEELTAQLAADHARSPYLDQARLAMARMKLQRALPLEATKYLEQVMKESGSAEVANIARLRLGRVLTQEEKYEDALKVLAPPGDSAFEPGFHEARGDAYYAMGKMDEARSEYAAALKGRDPATGDQAFLQAKLDEVAGSAPSPRADAANPTDAAAGTPAPAAN